MRYFLPLLAGLAVSAPAAEAHSYRLGPIRIGHLWAKPSGPGRFAVYGPLMNEGGAPDALVRVVSPARRTSAMLAPAKGGAPLKAIPLPPGRPVSLASWSAHIAVTGVAARKGRMIPLVLVFAHAGSIRVGAMVEDSPSD